MELDFLDNEIILKQDYQIFSSGHKNPQGIVKVGGELISLGHGPQGGDEINIIKQINWIVILVIIFI